MAEHRQSKTLPVPSFDVDLSLAPSQRWNHIISEYASRGEVEKMKTFMVGSVVDTFGRVGGTLLSLVRPCDLPCALGAARPRARGVAGHRADHHPARPDVL